VLPDPSLIVSISGLALGKYAVFAWAACGLITALFPAPPAGTFGARVWAVLNIAAMNFANARNASAVPAPTNAAPPAPPAA
jgi:hypothetical protein